MIRILHSPKGNQTPSPLLEASPALSGSRVGFMDHPLPLRPPQQSRIPVSSEGESDDFDSDQENMVPGSAIGRKYTRKSTESRRAAHLESEKKRRQNINQGFEDLRYLVPYCTELDSKAEILRKSANYIRKRKEGDDPDSVSVTSEEETLAKSLTMLRNRSKSSN